RRPQLQDRGERARHEHRHGAFPRAARLREVARALEVGGRAHRAAARTRALKRNRAGDRARPPARATSSSDYFAISNASALVRPMLLGVAKPGSRLQYCAYRRVPATRFQLCMYALLKWKSYAPLQFGPKPSRPEFWIEVRTIGCPTSSVPPWNGELVCV